MLGVPRSHQWQLLFVGKNPIAASVRGRPISAHAPRGEGVPQAHTQEIALFSNN